MARRLVAFFTVLAVSLMQLMPSFVFIVYADDSSDVNVSIGSVSGKQGDTVSVELNLEKNPGLNGLMVAVKYDTEALELISVDEKEMFAHATTTPANAEFIPGADLKISPFELRWTLSTYDEANPERMTDIGTLAVLNFKIKGTAADKDYPLTLETTPKDNFVIDPSKNPIFDEEHYFLSLSVAFENGHISVPGEKPPYTPAPEAPMIYNTTATSFDVSLPAGNEFTYSTTQLTDFSDCEWYANGPVTGLTPNTMYYVYQRTSETDDYAPSDVSSAAWTMTLSLYNSALLSSLSLSNGTFTPSFDPNVKVYYAIVPLGGVIPTVIAEASNANAQVTISQATGFGTGSNTATITVIAENGADTETYMITFTEQQKTDTPVITTDNSVDVSRSSSIEITGSGTIYYTTDGSIPTTSSAVYTAPISITALNIPQTVNTLTIKAVAIENGKALSDIADKSFILGNVDNDEPLLSNLTVNGVMIAGFSPNQTIYTYPVSYDEWVSDKFRLYTVEGTASDNLTVAVSETGSFALDSNDYDNDTQKVVSVVVSGSNGDSQTYTITFNVLACSHRNKNTSVISEATCTMPGQKQTVCLTCGKDFGTEEIPVLEHSYGEWIGDVSGHWKKCGQCGTASEIEAHIEDNGVITVRPSPESDDMKTYSCVLCGYQIRTDIVPYIPEPCEHTFSSDWKKDLTSHWHECNRCGEKVDVGTHTEDNGVITIQPTATTTGIMTYSCSICGHIMRTVILDHEHFFSSEWSTDLNAHWHDCINGSCSEKSDFGAHIEDGGVITVEPTATSAGIMTYSCKICSYTMRTETIPVVPPMHEHSFGMIWKYDSMQHWHECGCGEKTDVSYHQESGGVVTIQPTDYSDGLKTYSCAVCSYVLRTETIPATGVYIPPYNPNPRPNYIDPEVSVVTKPSDNNEVLEDDIVDKDITVKLECKLNEVFSKSQIETKKKFFTDSAIVRVSNTDSASAEAKKAVTKLDGGSDHNQAYPFDISIYNAYTNEKMGLRNGGYITFEIPIPESLSDISETDICVYHINNGQPELIDSTLVFTEDMTKIRFTATDFSPYMFTIYSKVGFEDISSGAGATAIPSPIDSGTPVTNGVQVPQSFVPGGLKLSNKKRKYRVVRKRKLDDLIFVY